MTPIQLFEFMVAFGAGLLAVLLLAAIPVWLVWRAVHGWVVSNTGPAERTSTTVDINV